MIQGVDGCGTQSFFGPAQEPVNGGAVDQPWEGSDSASEALTHGTHTEDQMQIFLALLDKKFEYEKVIS